MDPIGERFTSMAHAMKELFHTGSGCCDYRSNNRMVSRSDYVENRFSTFSLSFVLTSLANVSISTGNMDKKASLERHWGGIGQRVSRSHRAAEEDG